MTSQVTRSGFIAVAGRPNAGKSTFINQVVGHHVAIVSPIAQTTRRVVRAACTVGTTQLVFVDMPGSQQPVDRLTHRMQAAVEHTIGDVDVVLWVIDATDRPERGERKVADMVFDAGVPVVIALNKVDQCKPDIIARRITELLDVIGGREYHALVPISARSGDGCTELVAELSALLPEGAAWYDESTPTDMRDSERISEYVREAALGYLREELPHATIVEVDELEYNDDGSLHIECIIHVETESQKGIVVGKGGAMIRQIGVDARARIEQQFGVNAYLGLRVKVRKRWRDDDAWLERSGL